MDEDRIRVLVVEDNAGDVALLREALGASSVPMDAEYVDRLSRAIARLAQSGFDVIALDLTLPDSRGLDTYDRVHAEAPDVPVVVLTATQDQALGAETVQRGAQDYLPKGSVDGDTLCRCLRYAIERHRIRARLKDYLWRTEASEGQLRRTIEGSADGVIVVAEDGEPLFANPAAEHMLGHGMEELAQRPTDLPLTPDQTTEMSVMRRDGTVIAVEIRTTRTVWDGRDALLASLRDITDRRQAEELHHDLEVEALRGRQLAELGRLKSLFVETISHELRTPMAPLSTGVDMLLDGSLGEIDDDQRRQLERVRRHIQRLSRITTEVLDVSSEAPEEHLCRNVPLRPTLRPAVDLLRPKAHRHGVTLELEVTDDASAHADPDALCQVVASLVDATITHCPDGTRISITSHPLDEELVEIRIEDDGRGETAEALMREDPSLDDRVPVAGEGMLFGLAVCKSLVEGMGGALSFESRPGEGTVFRFSLPTPRS
jgi:two-component system, sensor histidine kinase and response regulator